MHIVIAIIILLALPALVAWLAVLAVAGAIVVWVGALAIISLGFGLAYVWRFLRRNLKKAWQWGLLAAVVWAAFLTLLISMGFLQFSEPVFLWVWPTLMTGSVFLTAYGADKEFPSEKSDT